MPAEVPSFAHIGRAPLPVPPSFTGSVRQTTRLSPVKRGICPQTESQQEFTATRHLSLYP
jgi:hypothetical protein